MIAYKQKKTKVKNVFCQQVSSTDVTASEMGLKSINSKCLLDPDYIMELGNNIRKFSPHVTIFERSYSLRRFFIIWNLHLACLTDLK